MKSLEIPRKVVWGQDAFEEFQNILRERRWKRVLVITDRGVQKAGLLALLEESLQKEGTGYEVVADIPAEPSWMALDAALKEARKTGGEAVIAVGGGSTMDAAKLFAAMLDSSLSVLEVVRDSGLLSKRLPLVMIPTTCGTGSEATCNAIVAVPEEKIKIGVVNPVLIPDYVILEPEMIRKLPKSILAATGMDALAHCVECYTSRKANLLSDLYAGAGAKLLFENLRTAYEEEVDLSVYAMLQLGAFYGGVAITGSGTTAVHALSYPLGGRYHIPHGISNAILFAPVMYRNEEACREELARLCVFCWPQCQGWEKKEQSRWVLKKLEELVQALEIPDTLKEFGVQADDLEELAEAGSQVRRLLDNNKRALCREEIREIYAGLL